MPISQPGRLSVITYFCLVRVTLTVIERVSQVPVTNEVRVKHANIFKSLVDLLPADKNIYTSGTGSDR